MAINNTKKLRTIREALFNDSAPSNGTPKLSIIDKAFQQNRYRRPVTGNIPSKMDDKASWGESSYDDMMLSQSELEQYGNSVSAMRAHRQPWSSQVANGLARFVPNVVMSTIGQTAAAFDLEDYKNSDDEVGNWLTTAMNKGTQAMNEALPIYRENPGKALDITDSGWWFDNGFSLVESITSFVATGGIVAKTITGLARGFKAMKLAQAILGANRAEKAANATGTVLEALMLNQSEAILEATDVYNYIYEEQLNKTGDEKLAKQKAADGAASTVLFNRLNIPLNLTSANLFMRAPQATRRLLENPYTKASLGRAALEGGQEAMEEVINNLANNYGKAVGMDKEYGLKEIVRDITTPEAAEAALLGFLGGMGQTALTVEGANRIRKTIDPETGKHISVRDYNIKQYENFKAEIKKLDDIAKSNNIGDFTSVFKSTADIQKIQKAITTADQVGEHEKAADLRKLLLANQAYTAFQRGTTKHLIELYEALGRGPQKDGMEDDYKTRASEAVTYIRQMEKVYNKTRQYANPEQVYYNRARAYDFKQEYLGLKRELAETESDISEISSMMIEQSGINPDELEDSFLSRREHTDKKQEELANRIKNSPEYKAKLEILDEIEATNKELIKLDKEYDKITEGAFQAKARKDKETAERRFRKLVELVSQQAEETAEKKEKAEKKEAVIKEQEAEAARIEEEKAAQVEDSKRQAKKLEDAAVGDIVTVTPQMSKKFVGKDAEVVKIKDGKVTLKDTETGHTFTVTKEKLTKQEPTPAEPEEDFSTEGGEYHEPITAEDVAKNDPSLDPDSPQPEDSGAKVVSTMGKGSDYLPFIKEQYPLLIKYERTPISKKDKPVTFEINTDESVLNDKQKDALKAYQNGDFSEEGILKMVEHLPINVVFRKESEGKDKINGPLETLPYTNKNGAQDNFDKATRYLRAHIVNALAQGAKPEEIIGSIQDQYKGLLQIDETPQGVPATENPVHELDYFNGDMSKVEVFMVNKDGNLVDTSGKVVRHGFKGKGEIYTKIPQANGEPFFLKLNVRKINKAEAEILYELYRQRMIDEETGIRTTLGNLPKELQDRIKQTLGPTEEQSAVPKNERPYLTPLELIGKKMKDITVKDITDFLIYDGSTNSKSQVRLQGAKLRYGNKAVFKNRVEFEKEKQRFIDFLVKEKRHHIKYRVKANDPKNIKIHAANRAYINYLLGTKTLSTNAVVGQPTFQGRTQIYLNLEVKYNKETIGKEHDPNKPRPAKKKEEGVPSDVDNVTEVPKVSEEATIIQQWNEEVAPFLEMIEQLENKIAEGNGDETDQKKLDNLNKAVDAIDAEYGRTLESKGYSLEEEETRPMPPTKPRSEPEGDNTIQVYKDAKSNWTLRVEPDGKVINTNTGKEITDDKKLINKAHLKSGHIKFTKIDLGDGKVYAVTEDNRIINISKKKDGKPSPSNGNEILATSSIGKKVLDEYFKREEEKETPAPKPKDPYELNKAEALYADMQLEGKMFFDYTEAEVELMQSISDARKKEIETLAEKNPEKLRKSGEKIVPLHEVPGTPESEAKQQGDREKPKGEKPPVKPSETEKEKEEKEKPDEVCGPPKVKKLTPKSRRGRKDKK